MFSRAEVRGVVRGAIVRGASVSGLLRRLHRLRHRRALTVFGIHRVLDPSDPRSRFAMPTWTVTPRLLREMLEIVSQEYVVVPLGDVIEAAEGRRELPDRAALLTFDDGWADTADTALPILRSYGLPSVTFVVSGLVGSRTGIWEAEWYAALVTASAADRQRAFERIMGRGPMDADLEEAAYPLYASLRMLPLPERSRLLEELLGGPVDQGGALMVDRRQLGEMIRSGMEIGAHSVSHEPLDANPDALQEISVSLREIDAIARSHQSCACALSYPHGRHRADLIEAASSAGALLQFTSEILATPVERGYWRQRLLGRVWIGRRLAAPSGGIDRPETEWDIFRAPVGHPDRRVMIG